MTPGELSVVAAIVGLAFGSFLNVCIYRLPLGRSLAFPASHCPRCAHPIAWYDNLPVIGYLVLRGRCRHCGAPYGLRYPLVEIVTAALFVVLVNVHPPGILLVGRLIFTCALIVLFVIDIDHRILPNVITLPGVIVGFLFSVFGPPGWASSLIGILIGGALPLGIALAYEKLRGHEGLGMGDVKMLAMIGAFLGWERMLLTLILASFLGSIVGVGFIAAGRGAKYALPFGTFLAVGALVADLAGGPILAWYFSFYD